MCFTKFKRKNFEIHDSLLVIVTRILYKISRINMSITGISVMWRVFRHWGFGDKNAREKKKMLERATQSLQSIDSLVEPWC